jgi:hypothetical protein
MFLVLSSGNHDCGMSRPVKAHVIVLLATLTQPHHFLPEPSRQPPCFWVAYRKNVQLALANLPEVLGAFLVCAFVDSGRAHKVSDDAAFSRGIRFHGSFPPPIKLPVNCLLQLHHVQIEHQTREKN